MISCELKTVQLMSTEVAIEQGSFVSPSQRQHKDDHSGGSCYSGDGKIHDLLGEQEAEYKSVRAKLISLVWHTQQFLCRNRPSTGN